LECSGFLFGLRAWKNSLLLFYKNLFKIRKLCEKAMCCLSVGKRPHEKYASLKMGALPLMHVALERCYTKFCLENENIEY
jgi:hypothetical protein